MKRVVGLDTSSWWGGMALVEKESAGDRPRVVAELGLAVQQSHAAHLLDWLQLLLDRAGWHKSSLDGYVAIRGPGSFTGIRVGLGTVRGLSLATGKPALGVTTLVAMAEAFGPAEGRRMPVLDAGRGEIFGACYDADSSPPSEVTAPWVRSADRVLERIDGGETTVLFGSGTEALEIPAAGRRSGLRVAPSPRSIAAAAAVLALLPAEPPVEAMPLAPLYLRAPDALVKRRNP